MKKMVLALSWTVLLAAFHVQAEADKLIEIEEIPQNRPPTVMERAFLRELGPVIFNVMNQHGDRQLFISERIETIVRDKQDDHYDVSLRVVGYEGPLNPPFKLIRMTLRFPGINGADYRVIHYEHRRITPDEAVEFSKFTRSSQSGE
ncbi:hypothetical protein [Bhargavaea cecembensis]|uniref:hypothetical protein n=1 Tax=Bhargavaea cecembensis TaxID=394098 RepID=UPI00058CB83C|nr:hypothetical protein [Bhargavaea cecembensis]